MKHKQAGYYVILICPEYGEQQRHFRESRHDAELCADFHRGYDWHVEVVAA